MSGGPDGSFGAGGTGIVGGSVKSGMDGGVGGAFGSGSGDIVGGGIKSGMDGGGTGEVVEPPISLGIAGGGAAV